MKLCKIKNLQLKTSFLFIFCLLFTINVFSKDIYLNNLVSSEGDGSQSSPFKTIYNSLNTNVNNDNLNIIITTNQTPYIINKCGNLTYNLSIFCVNGLAVLDFSENGMFYIENNYSLGFQNIIIQQSSSNFYQDQIIYFFNGLNISFQNCLLTNISINVIFLSATNSIYTSFYKTNFTSLDIAKNNFINITNVAYFSIDSCNFLYSNYSDANVIYSFNTKVSLANSFIYNNVIGQKNREMNYCFIRIGSSAIITNTIFQRNLLVNSSIIYIENDNINTETIIQIVNNVMVLYNTEIQEMTLGFNIIGQNIKILIDNNVTFQGNYAEKSLIYVSNTLNNIEIKGLYLINNFGFELIAFQLIRNLLFYSSICRYSNDPTFSYYQKNLINANPGNCLSIVNYINIDFQNCTFSYNFAISTLTGILLEHTSDISLLGSSQPNANLANIECSNNIVNASSNVLINSGNCILLINLGNTTMINNNFSYNVINVDLTGKFSGNPCLISESNENNLIILNSIFKGNQAYSECSCLNFHGTQFILKNTSFIENRSIKLKIGDSDPLFYIANEGGCLNLGAATMIIDNVLLYNSSAMKGAGIFFHDRHSKGYQTLNSLNLNLSKNQGTQTAGMEFDATMNLGEFVFMNTVINNNQVSFYGVVSTFYYTNVNLYFYYNDIFENWGVSAGAAFAFCHFGGNIYFNNTNFTRNVLNQTVFVGGGAIFVYGYTVSTLIYVKDCIFLENYSSLKGGAIQSTYGQVFVWDSIFIDNFAQIGGAISMSVFCPGAFQNVIVQNKFKVNQGGAVHCTDFASFNLINVTFIDCQARDGGAVYVDGSELTFHYENLSFYNVQADNGAAIWVRNTFASQTTFQNIFVSNTVTTSQSIINIDTSNIFISNLTISNSQGRSIFINNSTAAFIAVSVMNHYCLDSNNVGCFALSQKNSLIILQNLYFKNVTSFFSEDVISITKTEISILNVTIFDFNTTSNTLLITATDSFVYIQQSILKNIGKSLIQAANTELHISDCSFINITSSTIYGIIVLQSGLGFLIENSIFDSINGNLGGCISLLGGSSNYYYNATNVTIQNCIANQGSGFYISDQNFIIFNSTFSNNIATSAGGCIYFGCSVENDYKWLIYSSQFINNTANQGGAYHSIRYIPKFDKNTIFVRNHALYGNDFSGFPIKLSLEINNKIIVCDATPLLCYIQQGITSGQIMPPIVITVLDYYNQKMTLLDGLGFLNLAKVTDNIADPPSYENITENLASIQPEAVFTGVETQKLLNGSFNFSEAMITSQPPSNIWLKVKTDLIPKFFTDLFTNESFFHKNDQSTGGYYFFFKVFFRECIAGEVYANQLTECFSCPKGKYSFFVSDKTCKTCPITAQCSGGTNFNVKPGYWRPSVLSDDVYACNVLTDSCLGGVNSSCLNGYTGVLCGACEFDGDKKFFKKGLFYCEECQNVWIYIVIVIIVMIMIFAFIFFLISSRKGSNIENYVLVKIITDHIQTVSFMSNIKISFPKFLVGFTGMQAPATSMDSVVFTIQCFKDQIGLSNFETKLILSVIIPIAVILLIVLTFMFHGVYKRKKRVFIIESIINALVIIGSFFQPPFINFYIQNLSCDKIANASYLTYNLEQECWDETHAIYSSTISFPFLLFWMVIFPLIFFVYMTKNRKRLHHPSVKQLIRFFLAGYKDDRYYWEFVQMSRKFSVILLTTFLRNKPDSVVYILVPVVSFYYVMQIIMMPYAPSPYEFNFLEILSLNACFITYYSAVFYLRVVSETSRTFFLVIIVIFNGIFLVSWGRMYVFFLKGKIARILSSLSITSKTSKSKATTEKRQLKSIDTGIKLKIKPKKSKK